ncbi:Capsid vertex component 1, partial [Dissostichus eleginoides]
TAVTPPGVWRRWNVRGERACPKKRESPPSSPNKARQSEIPFSHPFNLDGSFHTTVCTSPGSTMNPGLPPCLPDRLLS